jgi:hypothetical protein
MADQKITALTEISLPTLDDLMYCVDDPAGVPVSNKLSLARFLGQMFAPTCQGRLTLAPANPLYLPQPSTPVSTDTTGETCTFTLPHGWVTGTLVTVYTTVGGLTAGNRYFLNCPSSTTCSFHTTVALAIAGTSKVDLTASITTAVVPSGVSGSTIYFSPFNGDKLSLYDGTRWKMYVFTERSLALGTLTANLNYDVFCYDNAGTVTLELLAWTSDTVRATALVRQDGVWSKTGALTRRYLGTIRTDSTTTSIDDWGSDWLFPAKRFVWNWLNRVNQRVRKTDPTGAGWSYALVTWRQARAAADNQIEVVTGLSESMIQISVRALHELGTTGIQPIFAIGEDSTTVPSRQNLGCMGPSGSGSGLSSCEFSAYVPLGYHKYVWLERIASGVTLNIYGDFYDSGVIRYMTGMQGSFDC